MVESEYLRMLADSRLAAIARVLEASGYGELPARRLAYDILDAQVLAEMRVLDLDAYERHA